MNAAMAAAGKENGLKSISSQPALDVAVADDVFAVDDRALGRYECAIAEAVGLQRLLDMHRVTRGRGKDFVGRGRPAALAVEEDVAAGVVALPGLLQRTARLDGGALGGGDEGRTWLEPEEQGDSDGHDKTRRAATTSAAVFGRSQTGK